MAVALLENYVLASWHVAIIPVGICVALQALSVLFTCCPPAPLALNVSMRISFSSIEKSLGTSGITTTVAVLECILPAFSVSGTR